MGIFSIAEQLQKIKCIIMTTAGCLLFMCLLGSAILPLFAFIHFKQISDTRRNYDDTIPPIREYRGLQSTVPIERGRGWVNPVIYNPENVFRPNYIIDYGKCLSRALYRNEYGSDSGTHIRISLCGLDNAVSGNSSNKYFIDVREFISNEKFDVAATSVGIHMSLSEYGSLLHMADWVESWVFKERDEFRNRQRRKYYESLSTTQPSVETTVVATEESPTALNVSLQKGIVDASDLTVEERILLTELASAASAAEQQYPWELPPFQTGDQQAKLTRSNIFRGLDSNGTGGRTFGRQSQPVGSVIW
jgi:hypothetical protein